MALPLFVATTVLLCLPGSLVLADDVPSTGFIAAALENQEAAAGKSLEVKYEYQEERDASPCHVRYVRTPVVLYIEFSKDGFMTRSSFNRLTSEYRQLFTTEAGTKYGLVQGRLAPPLSTRLPMDPVRYNVPHGALREAVKSGAVASSREAVSNRSCWRVDIPAASGHAAHRIWSDPDNGFCPRRIEIPREGRDTQVIEFSDYRDLGGGVWFPGLITNQFEIPNVGKLRYLSRLQEVNLGKAFSADELIVTFPPGTQVRNDIMDAVYVIP
jgi:hypothetical protein